MMSSSKITMIVIAIFIGIVSLLGNYYQAKAIGALKNSNHQLTEQLALAKQTNQQQVVQMLKVQQIDKQRSEELADALAKIEELEDAIESQPHRLLVNASCPKRADNTASPSVANGGACELTAAARSDYFRLRRGLATERLKVKGLQEYIKALPAECVAREP